MGKISGRQRAWCGVAGGLSGVVNGFFGGGGGTVLVPMLAGPCGLSQQEAFANSVLIIFPLCAVSSAIYFFRGEIDLISALPYLLGGAVGGYLGGRLFKRVSPELIRKIFALFILYGGVNALL